MKAKKAAKVNRKLNGMIKDKKKKMMKRKKTRVMMNGIMMRKSKFNRYHYQKVWKKSNDDINDIFEICILKIKQNLEN